MTDEPAAESYRSRIIAGVLQAIMDAGTDEQGQVSTVDLPVAVSATCDAIAVLVASTGTDKTPKDRRDTADLVRRRVFEASNEIARKIAEGEHLPFTLTEAGTVQ